MLLFNKKDPFHNSGVYTNVIFSTHSYDGAYIGQWYTIPSESLKVCKKSVNYCT